VKFKIDKKSVFNYLLYLGIIALGVATDQLTKLLAVKHLKGNDPINILGDLFRLRYETNKGMAFGLMEEHRWVFMTVSTVAIIAMLAYLFAVRNQGKLYTVSISIIASGGIGNMIDRISLGYVVDFFDLKGFAVFNVADSYVCIGAGLLVLALITDIVKEAKLNKNKNKEDSGK
jgi:signal peptidase II